ncbi:MAG: TonB-dependent receptor [bacterium]|nr:TonB-dependent receptor [bacterium]
MNVSRNVSVGNQSTVFGKPLGYLVSLSYGDSYSRRTDQQYAYTARLDESQGIFVEPYEDYVVDRSSRSVNWCGLLDLNTKRSPMHKVSLKTMYNRGADDDVRITQGYGGDGELFRNYRLSWTERSILTTQLKGSHEFTTLLKSRFEWSGAVSKASYDQPDRRDVAYIFNDDEDINTWEFWGSTTSGYRRFAEMDDDVLEAQLDWSVPLVLQGDRSSKLKFGGLARTMDRTFPTRKFQMRFERDPGTEAMELTLPPEVIYSPESIDKYFVLAEVTSTLDSYDATMDVMAGYAMADMQLWKKWRAVGGVRVEQTDQQFQTYPYPGSASAETASGGPKHTDVLPSLNLTYKLNDEVNLRAAGSMTIANPDYAEIVPTEDNDYFDGGAKVGNPDIKHTRILNGDLRAEFYPTPGENLSFGIFVKQIKDPIEHILVPNGASVILRPDNLVDATNLGAEFEFRKSMTFLVDRVADWMQFFSLIGNVTFVSSDVKLKDPAYSVLNPQSALTSSSRPMMGQSDYILNAALAFDQPIWGTNARVLFNTFGERISRVGGYGIPDTYEQPFTRVDVAFNQRLSTNWTVKVLGSNLLNPEVKFRTGDEPLLAYKTGRTFSAGISYSL